MSVTRTFDLLERYNKEYPKIKDAFANKVNGKWNHYSSRDYINNANWLSLGLLQMGLKKGDFVATISNNRPEWNFLDMALSQTGIIHVPIYPTISKEDYNYILNHCVPVLVFVSDKLLFEKIAPLVQQVSGIKDIYCFNEVAGAKNWKEILDSGKKIEKIQKEKLQETRDSITENDPVTLIYTSGTTGFPKGVLLSHKNLVSNFIETSKVHHLSECRILSFLPLSHVYERMVNYHFQYKGMSIYYAENMGTIIQDLKEVSHKYSIQSPVCLKGFMIPLSERGKIFHF